MVLAGLAWGAIPVVVGVGFYVDRLRRQPQGRVWEHCWVCGARGPYGRLADARFCCPPCRMDVMDEVDVALGINPVSNSDPGVPRLLYYQHHVPKMLSRTEVAQVLSEIDCEPEELPFVTMGQASKGRM